MDDEGITQSNNPWIESTTTPFTSQKRKRKHIRSPVSASAPIPEEQAIERDDDQGVFTQSWVYTVSKQMQQLHWLRLLVLLLLVTVANAKAEFGDREGAITPIAEFKCLVTVVGSCPKYPQVSDITFDDHKFGGAVQKGPDPTKCEDRRRSWAHDCRPAGVSAAVVVSIPKNENPTMPKTDYPLLAKEFSKAKKFLSAVLSP